MWFSNCSFSNWLRVYTHLLLYWKKKWPWQKNNNNNNKKNTYIIIICHCFHDLIIVLMLFFYGACIDIRQQLCVCAICLKLRWCNDYYVMVWLGEFCSIQNYLYNWHSIFFMKTSKPNNHPKYFAIFSQFLFTTSWFRFSESQILHKPIYNNWTSK